MTIISGKHPVATLHSAGSNVAIGSRSWRSSNHGRPRRWLRVKRSRPSAATKGDCYFTSKIASTSTAMLPGSEPMPTALRAPFPGSPNTSTIRSLNPLMTAGWF